MCRSPTGGHDVTYVLRWIDANPGFDPFRKHPDLPPNVRTMVCMIARICAISVAIAFTASGQKVDRALTAEEIVKLARQKIKYVFVIYQENRSFDSYFGTFPGAEGLFTHEPTHTPGFYQQIVNTDGTVTTIIRSVWTKASAATPMMSITRIH